MYVDGEVTGYANRFHLTRRKWSIMTNFEPEYLLTDVEVGKRQL